MICPTCNGKGGHYSGLPAHYADNDWIDCDDCQGSGEVAEDFQAPDRERIEMDKGDDE